MGCQFKAEKSNTKLKIDFICKVPPFDVHMFHSVCTIKKKKKKKSGPVGDLTRTSRLPEENFCPANERPRFNPRQVLIFSFSHLVRASYQYIVIDINNTFISLHRLFWSSHALLVFRIVLRLAKVKLIGYPQIFLTKKEKKKRKEKKRKEKKRKEKKINLSVIY